MADREPPKADAPLSDYAPFRKKMLTADEARQGVTGHKVRYVLLASLVLSLVALYAVRTSYERRPEAPSD